MQELVHKALGQSFHTGVLLGREIDQTIPKTLHLRLPNVLEYALESHDFRSHVQRAESAAESLDFGLNQRFGKLGLFAALCQMSASYRFQIVYIVEKNSIQAIDCRID